MQTILLIEDEETIGAMARIILQRGGYLALFATSAEEARAIWTVHREAIRLIVTDNSLPDGSGLALAGEFQREKPAVKIIVTSGNSPSNLSFGYLILPKPFLPVELLVKVQELIGPPEVE